MKHARTPYVVLMTGAALLLLGVIWTLNTAAGFSAQSASLQRKQADAQTLEIYTRATANQRAVVALFDALERQRLTDITALVREAAPNVSAEVRRRESTPVWEGWTAQQIEIQLDNIPLPTLGRLMDTFTASRPPWSIVEGNLLALDHVPGHARVTLLVEGLEKR